MTHGKIIENNQDKIAACGDYYILAKRLNNLFITLTTKPALLFKYLQTKDKTLLKESDKMLPFSPITNYLLPWAELLQNNQVPLDKVYVLYYSILCRIIIPGLSPQDSLALKNLQQNCSKTNLIFEEYGSTKVQKGFDTLTSFFCQQYLWHYSSFSFSNMNQ